MRILILVNKLTGGGAERVAALWARGFVERGYAVEICLSCRETMPVTYKVPESVAIQSIWSRIGKVMAFVGLYETYAIWRLKKVIEVYNPDIIIGVLPPFAEWARRATKKSGIKIINTNHNAFERPEGVSFPNIEIKNKFEWNKNFDHVTVLTESDLRLIKDNPLNTTVLPNPLAFEPVSTLPPKEKIILAAGRVDAWYYKGFDLLIKAWGKIAQRHTEWKLQIAGDGNQKNISFLQEIADDNHIGGQLELIGYCKDMIPVYQRSSIFVLSSRYEGFGMVLIEAMSQGCAPIACDYKGRQREIIANNDEGMICPVDDVDSLASAIETLIVDEIYREKLQKGAVKRSEKYRLENIMSIWGRIFDELKE